MKIYFLRIIEEFDKQNEQISMILNKNQMKILINSLNLKEQDLLGQVFKTISWNVGSLHILKILQDCNILSASEYILQQGDSEEDFEHIQCVMSDMLESNSELFANIINNCAHNSSNTKLIFYLDEAMLRLLKDFQENENIISSDFFRKLLPFLEGESLEYLTCLCLNFLLELSTDTAKEALGQIDNWKSSISSDSKFYELLKEIVISNLRGITNKILQVSLYPNFNHWKYLIITLDIVARNSDSSLSATIKKHLRDTFKLAIMKGSLNLMCSLLIIARTVCNEAAESLFDTYSLFYKNTFGDLKYVVSNKSEFENTIDLLNTIIEAETNPKYLELKHFR
ncbi:uncharacterized protein LOC129606759 isoform X2 [Condylostylus longicornis]|uniref:uncharacterized protein LOC129606759 isoform X2 n=1 Tax=Condylostylus longicornis TaxID=2530218 RepID=UPI00244DBEF4|nr:uncharacterized protein LOC129606759 isoform X2 [Condylostylus longicornis]